MNNPNTKKNLSSSGVQLMPSMDAGTGCSTSLPVSTDNLFARPGYKLLPFVDDFISTPAGDVPVVSPAPGWGDLFSNFCTRLGINRDRYTVAPGLYAVGSPDKGSEVLVTANFKLTFDHLRKELKEVSAWILVLDTKGINVWCAAGKGTFSTGELVDRIEKSLLDKIVDHRRVILPQLGAVGVSAGKVKQQSGFRVVYGPVRASDIPAFLKNNRKAEPHMREVTFNMAERFILTPVEISLTFKPAIITLIVLFILSGIGPGYFSFLTAVDRWLLTIPALAAGILSGAVLTPVLLPFLWPRHFAAKGMITGFIIALAVLVITGSAGSGILSLAALLIFGTITSSFLAMNFTGATPFTSPSGVEKEMKRYIPVQVVSLLISAGLWIYSAF